MKRRKRYADHLPVGVKPYDPTPTEDESDFVPDDARTKMPAPTKAQLKKALRATEKKIEAVDRAKRRAVQMPKWFNSMMTESSEV